MVEHAVWTGLAALLATSLGIAVGSFSGLPSLNGWPIVFLYAAAIWIFLSLPGTRGGPRAERPAASMFGRPFLMRGAAGAAGLAALFLLWLLTGDWEPFLVGVAGIAAATGTAIFVRRVAPSGAREGAFPLWRAEIASLAVSVLLLTVVLPLVGFTGLGRRGGEYPWAISGTLAVSALPFVVAGELGTYDPHGPGANSRVRLVILGITTLCFSGVVLAGTFFPVHAEVRMLAVSAAAVTSVLAFAGLIYPQPLLGLNLSRLLVRVSFILLVAGYAVLYVLL